MQNAPREHSAILSTFIKLPFVFRTFVLSIFEWPLKTGFTVYIVFKELQAGHLSSVAGGIRFDDLVTSIVVHTKLLKERYASALVVSFRMRWRQIWGSSGTFLFHARRNKIILHQNLISGK